MTIREIYKVNLRKLQCLTSRKENMKKVGRQFGENIKKFQGKTK